MTTRNDEQQMNGDRMNEGRLSDGKLSEQRCIQLSGFMDGDLPPKQELDALLGDADARATWGRYHLIRDAVQNELPEQYCDLSSRISLVLDEEPTVLAPRPRPANGWQKAIGLAVAASVFAIAIVSFQSFDSPDNAVVVATVAEPAPAPVVAVPSQIADAPLVIDDERARLEDMLINHTEAVSANGLNVMLPYARVVSDRIDVSLDDPSVDDHPIEELPADSASGAQTQSVVERVQP